MERAWQQRSNSVETSPGSAQRLFNEDHSSWWHAPPQNKAWENEQIITNNNSAWSNKAFLLLFVFHVKLTRKMNFTNHGQAFCQRDLSSFLSHCPVLRVLFVLFVLFVQPVLQQHCFSLLLPRPLLHPKQATLLLSSKNLD